MTRSKLVAVLILGVFLSQPSAAKLYKWVDEHGTTHYGETVPPEYANKDRAELNQDGRVMKKQDVLTPEERRAARSAREQEQARKLDEEQAALEKKRRDTALIDTYSSPEEIELARKRNLQQIELRINGISANIDRANENLLGLQKEADAYTRDNQPLPDSLKEDLRQTRQRLDKLQKDMEKPLAEKAAMDARYDAERARYKELTGK